MRTTSESTPTPLHGAAAWHSDRMTTPRRPLSATLEEPELWFEDFEVGQVFELGEIVAEHDEIIEFARRFDPQWYHVDEQAANDSSWGGLIASGWWTGAGMMRVYVDNFLSKTAPDASPGMENVRWHRAVYAGDRLAVRLTVTDKKDSSRGPHLGTLYLHWEALRGDELVMSFSGRGWFYRRPAD